LAPTQRGVNLLTGYSQPQLQRFLLAPLGLKAALLGMIAAEAEAVSMGASSPR